MDDYDIRRNSHRRHTANSKLSSDEDFGDNIDDEQQEEEEDDHQDDEYYLDRAEELLAKTSAAASTMQQHQHQQGDGEEQEESLDSDGGAGHDQRHGRLELDALSSGSEGESTTARLMSHAGKRRPLSASATTSPRAARTPRNRNAKDVIAKSVEEEFSRQCTFRPAINEFSSSLVRRPLEERIEQMSRRRQEVLQKREMERLRREQAEMERCTFKPQIMSSAGSTPAVQIPAEERLFHDADHRIVNRERAKREMEEQEIATFSFRPRINETSERIIEDKYRPVHERVGELQRAKYEKMQRLRVESEQLNKDLTFVPAINEKSSRLASHRSTMDIAERLAGADVANKLQRRAVTQEEHNRRQAEEFTFTPKINENSQRIVEESEMFAGSRRDFVQRQKEWMKAQQRRLEMDKQIVGVLTEPQFRPQINENSEAIIAAKTAAALEDQSGKIDRLAYRDKARKEALQEAIKEQYHAQFSYQPDINPVSKVIGRSSKLTELVTNERSKKAKERIAREAERQFQQDYTFKPAIQSGEAGGQESSRILKDPESLTKNIQQMRLEKERRIEEARKELEYAELKECTFQPVKISERRRVKQPDGPILVRGLGKYLERKEAARRQAEEQREREEKVFLVHPVGGARSPAAGAAAAGAGSHNVFTIPQPFHLHGDYRSEMRRQRMEEEIRRKEMAECTFHPRTNEAHHRELLQKILQD